MMPDATGMLVYSTSLLTMALISAIICLGLNLQWGKMGLFNAGVAAFVAMGAYTSGLLTTPPTEEHWGGYAWPIAAGAISAMAVSGIASALVGAVTLRLKADYLAIGTFGFAVLVQLILRNARHLTGGTFGISFIPRPWQMLADRPLWFGLANLALVGALALLVWLALESLTRSPWGRVVRALREDERAAAALGKNALRYRLQAFSVGGAIMGLAGSLQAHLIGFIAPENFAADLTFQVWTMLIIGGSGNNLGALLGAGLVTLISSATGFATGLLFPPQEQARAAAMRLVIIGVLLAGTILLRPRGLVGERLKISSYIGSARKRAQDAAGGVP
jgi:branched-chain amino acid transport system permease protein